MHLTSLVIRRGLVVIAALAVLFWVAGCGSASTPSPAPAPAGPEPASSPGPTATASPAANAPAATQPPASRPAPATGSTGQPAPADLLALPSAFRYEVTLQPVESATAAQAVITGQYREGEWAQIARTVTAADAGGLPRGEELIVAGGASYTRPVGEAAWTRWPGVGFDAAYGLASPFTVLRLYPLAGQRTRGVLAPAAGAPEPTLRSQAVIPPAAIARVLAAAAATLAPDAASQAALQAQAAAMAVQQTITYWATAEGRVYRATAALLAADQADQPAAWLEATWRFWGYDDPTIAIAAPSASQEAPGLAASQPQPTAPPASRASGPAELRVLVYASPGILATDLAVTVYPAGETRQPLDWRRQAEARFSLPPGRYDVLVQMDYAQEWLQGIEVGAGQSAARDVTFYFGLLHLTAVRNGRPVAVDIVTYPAGDRQNWVDWRSDNPASIRLRAGVYDVEIAYADYTRRQIVRGLEVKAGATTTRTVELVP